MQFQDLSRISRIPRLLLQHCRAFRSHHRDQCKIRCEKKRFLHRHDRRFRRGIVLRRIIVADGGDPVTVRIQQFQNSPAHLAGTENNGSFHDYMLRFL